MPKNHTNLSLREAVNLLTYSYDIPYSTREKIYFKILNSFSPDLLRLDSSSSPLTSEIFDFSCLPFRSLKGQGFQYLANLSSTFKNELVSFAKQNLQIISNSPKSQVPPEVLHSHPPLLKLFCSRHIVDPISDYLNIIPSIQYISLWQTNPTKDYARTSEMYWHMDHHGHKFVKAFYYLSDVQLGDGHHEFILNSHIQPSFDTTLASKAPKLTKSLSSKRVLRGKFQLADDLLLPIMDRCLSIVGPSGSGFMEDTRGLHRGTPIISQSSRIILQALFVPFDSMKDPIHKVSISSHVASEIQRCNSYTQSEISKLLSIIN
tara:strand:- start:4492 stop:5448 length:957 start_codon:yes stop_codon:yes gene_type:complete